MPPHLSAVVPVYDEADSLPFFHAELVSALEALGRDCEVVYVDDGSADGSTDLLHKLHLERPDLVRVVVLRRNFGKAGALAAGFAAARGQLLVTLDADGQDDPGQLPRLLQLLEDGDYDLVGGWRRTREDRLVKRWTSQCYNAATRTLTGLALHDFNTGFKVLRAEVAAEVPLYGEFHRFVPVLAHDLGFRVGEVEVRHRARRGGRSKYLSLLRFPKTLLDLLTVLFLTRFADRPLHFFGAVGAALSAAGLAILAYLSVLKLAFGEGIGQRPLLLLGVVALLVGVQLVGTGFIGDVLRHSVARERRSYRVREVFEQLPGRPPLDRRGMQPADRDARRAPRPGPSGPV
ncbi:MAG: glycosyltransferase family 2 protein [Actinomycetota bacterium]|nr:glycosyltransferase family 2 protein [Actinomycetota bacterium]